ncbi:MAG: endonuclease MutS2 [Ruminococcus sp.]|nr:endonuclease MutS2 [Ruminococcus sp.]
MNIYHEKLELNKILELLIKHCSNDRSRQLAAELEPSDDIETVRTEIAKTSCALELSIKLGSPVFYSFKDISGSVKRAESGAALSLAELIEIKRMLQQIGMLTDWYKDVLDKENPLDRYFECLFPNKHLMQKLETSIIDSETLADEASPTLASIRKKIRHSEVRIRETLEKMIKSSSVQKYLQDSIVTIRDGRFVLPVRTEHKAQVSGLVHDTSSTGSTLFIEPMSVVEANNDIRILKGEEQDEIHRIILELSADCAQFAEQLISGFEASAELGLYFAKAELAADMHACEPELNEDNMIILNKARHPLIDAKKVVPINIQLGTDFDTLIITGPNTGGKTVVLKTVGLITLMTMCGLLVPVSDGSKVCIYKNILVDIGDQQSIEQDLSTFSSHINNVIEIMDSCDYRSLVLLDELGSGTDPIEGAALAVAMIEELRSRGASIITTTHYQELKMYALDTARVENASCEFDVENLQPTYRLIIGAPGKSNAFAISKKLGVPAEVIEKARSLVSDDNRRFEQIIDNLEAMRVSLEKQKQYAEKDLREAEKIKKELEEARERFYDEREAELENARAQAADIVNRVQRQSQALVDELEKVRKEKEAADFSDKAIKARQHQRQVMNKLYRDADPVSQSRNEDYVLPRPLQKGDSVLIVDSNRKAILVSEPDSKGMCYVQVGVMKTKVDSSKLRLLEKEKPQKQKQGGGVSTKGVESRMTRKVSTELDIRGYSADEGVYEVDNFLDAAVLSGIGIVTIIHGKGTGVLKNAVREHLKRHPHVKSSRRGLYGEGEDGVTIVELK